MSAAATATAAGVRAHDSGSFYPWAALVCVLIAFLGFVPTYWLPLAAGKFQANPVVHIHGIIFFAWTLYFLLQSTLPSSGRLALHRSLGIAGASLATLVFVLGLLAALNTLRTLVAIGMAEAGEAFIIVPLVGIATFAVLASLAFANTRRPEVHKRLMLCATVAILPAPMARPFLAWVLDLPPGPPPVSISWVNLLCLLIVVAGMVHDWRTRGRPHPAYVVTLPVLIFITWVVIPLSATAGWHAIARAYLGLAGQLPGPP
jgi:hypothetical protein